MPFKKYQHVERLGSSAVDGLLDGTCYAFPKIDGTNAQVFFENGELCAGSRNRKLSLDNDNAGFLAHVFSNGMDYIKALKRIADEYEVRMSEVTLYGEWLVPHTLKTYRKDAWREFYLFDVTVEGRYIPYDIYKRLNWLNIIPPIAILENPTLETISGLLDKNTFLIDNPLGKPELMGEGVVVKRYLFTNKYGRTVWGKLVRSEFKERNLKEMGAPVMRGKTNDEQRIVDVCVTETLLDKEFAKIAIDGWESRMIPQFLGTVYHAVITEELWGALKKVKRPVVDFQKLNKLVTLKCKEYLKEKYLI